MYQIIVYFLLSLSFLNIACMEKDPKKISDYTYLTTLITHPENYENSTDLAQKFISSDAFSEKIVPHLFSDITDSQTKAHRTCTKLLVAIKKQKQSITNEHRKTFGGILVNLSVPILAGAAMIFLQQCCPQEMLVSAGLTGYSIYNTEILKKRMEAFSDYVEELDTVEQVITILTSKTPSDQQATILKAFIENTHQKVKTLESVDIKKHIEGLQNNVSLLEKGFSKISQQK